MKGAKEVIKTFWKIQDEGDYTKVVELFAEDAVLVDPFFGIFEGKEAIGKFMKKMNIFPMVEIKCSLVTTKSISLYSTDSTR